MKIFLIQSVLSPYREKLFQTISSTPGIDFTLCLLSKAFKTRPQWKRSLDDLPFKTLVPFGISFRTSPEHEFCVNPFLFFTLLREKPDVVVCGGYSPASLSVWLWSRISGRGYVIWTEATMHTDRRIKGLRLSLRSLLAKNCGAFVEAGTLAREYVQHIHPKIDKHRLFRAYNCVDSKTFSEPGEAVAQFGKERGFPEKNLLFVGKLNERKGVHRLFEVYQRIVRSSENDLGIILVGDGPLQDDINREKANKDLHHVYLEGWQANEDTAKYYSFASAFVLLSSVDHNPLVLFEALAAGMPIICSSGACNAVDFIRDGVNGFIVDPHDIDQIVDRTKEVLGWGAGQLAACKAYSEESVGKANYTDAANGFVRACEHSNNCRVK